MGPVCLGTYPLWYLSRVEGDAILSWSWDGGLGQLCAKEVYNALSQMGDMEGSRWCYKSLWKWNIPTKLNCFNLLCLEKKILTWDNSIKRGGFGPNRCPLCTQSTEYVDHLFFFFLVLFRCGRKLLGYLIFQRIRVGRTLLNPLIVGGLKLGVGKRFLVSSPVKYGNTGIVYFLKKRFNQFRR